jgi:hypothetical protein
MDDYKHKYLKYKKKYLMLVEEQKKLNNTNNYKIFLGGGSIVIGSKVKTIPNSGSLESMTNQCFWISILNYLQSNGNGNKNLTLRELRTNAGLDSQTEHMMFDTNYLINKGNENIPIFFNAANRIAKFYDIQIEVYSVNREGEVLNQRDEIGNSTNIVPIAQFGLQHFELIDKKGKTFIPAVPINGKLTTTTDIDPKYKNLYIQLNENLGMIDILNDDLKQFREKYNNSITNKDHILKSYDIPRGEKNNIVFHINKELDETVTAINNLEKKITDYQNENLSIIHIINESKCGSSSSVTQKTKIFGSLPNNGTPSSYIPQQTKIFGSLPNNGTPSSYIPQQTNPFGPRPNNGTPSSYIPQQTNPFGPRPNSESSSSSIAQQTNPFGLRPNKESSSSSIAQQTNPFGLTSNSGSSFVAQQPKRCLSSRSSVTQQTNIFGLPPNKGSSTSSIAQQPNYPIGLPPNKESSIAQQPNYPIGLPPNKETSSSSIAQQPNIFGLLPNKGSS